MIEWLRRGQKGYPGPPGPAGKDADIEILENLARNVATCNGRVGVIEFDLTKVIKRLEYLERVLEKEVD